MASIVQLEDDQWPVLREAVRRWREPQKKLAERAGLSESALSRIVNGQQRSIDADALHILVSTLGLDATHFFRQLELPLDESRLDEVEKLIASELRRIGNEVGTLRGSAFQVFVGFRVEGAVQTVYERHLALRPPAQGEAPDAGSSVNAA